MPSVNAVSGNQELQWMVQPHFLGPSGYPRPLTYPQYSPPQPRPGVIRALGPPPGVRRRPCEQVRNGGVALSIALRGRRRQGQDPAVRELLLPIGVPGRSRKRPKVTSESRKASWRRLHASTDRICVWRAQKIVFRMGAGGTRMGSERPVCKVCVWK